jgi:hypothetical protein
MQFVKVDGQGLRESTTASPGRLNGGLDEGRPRSAWSVIKLSCGHCTTPETDEVYRLWRPTRGKHYCESCHKWVKRLARPKAKEMANDVLPF